MEKIKCFLSRSNQPACLSSCLLLLRLVVGVAFIIHGWDKIQNPFAWMPPESAAPGFFQMLAAVSEFGGGISLIIGLLVPLSMLGLSLTMLIATVMHAIVWGHPFVSKSGGSFELPLLYFVVCLLFIVTGAGRYSLDAKIFCKGSCDKK